MTKIKIALLEDNKEQLKERRQILIDTALADVVVWSTSSGDFLNKINQTAVDALVVDIDLVGDSMNGLEVAFQLKLPVLFVSGHNATNLKDIETLKREYDLQVEHITKPFPEKDLIKTFKRFIYEVESANKQKFIYLDFADSKRNKIALDTIVCLYTDKAQGAESNNKIICFIDRTPETLINFSFTTMEEKGFSKNKFITIHKSYRVNVDRITRYIKDKPEIEVTVFEASGKATIRRLPVSENYRNDVSKFMK